MAQTPGAVELADAEATEALGVELAAQLVPTTLLLLEGPLGAGKTTLVRGVVRGLGGDPEDVCSPTFTLHAVYPVAGRRIRRVHHLDLYRLRGLPRAPWDELGVVEVVEDRQGVTAIEWPEEWPWLAEAGRWVLRVRLSLLAEGRGASVAWLAPPPQRPAGEGPGRVSA